MPNAAADNTRLPRNREPLVTFRTTKRPHTLQFQIPRQARDPNNARNHRKDNPREYPLFGHGCAAQLFFGNRQSLNNLGCLCRKLFIISLNPENIRPAVELIQVKQLGVIIYSHLPSGGAGKCHPLGAVLGLAGG